MFSLPPSLVSARIQPNSYHAISEFPESLLDIGRIITDAWLFLCAVMFSAWYGGIKPGLLAAVLSILVFDYYFVNPIYSFTMEIKEIPRFSVFVLSALLVGLLSAAQRSATESLRLARDGLATTVQELKQTNEALHAENATKQSLSIN